MIQFSILANSFTITNTKSSSTSTCTSTQLMDLTDHMVTGICTVNQWLILSGFQEILLFKFIKVKKIPPIFRWSNLRRRTRADGLSFQIAMVLPARSHFKPVLPMPPGPLAKLTQKLPFQERSRLLVAPLTPWPQRLNENDAQPITKNEIRWRRCISNVFGIIS